MLIIPHIRLAVPDDAGVIAGMSRDYIEWGLPWSWRAARVRSAILDRSTNVAVVPGGDEIIGFGIMQVAGDTAHLALFAIRPTHRHRGLGRVLMAWLEKPVAVAGVQRIRLEARADNLNALAFYRRLGFTELARVPGYYQGAIDAVRLEKRL